MTPWTMRATPTPCVSIVGTLSSWLVYQRGLFYRMTSATKARKSPQQISMIRFIAPFLLLSIRGIQVAEHVLDHRSAVRKYRILAASHVTGEFDVSCCETSCDGSSARIHCYAAPGPVRCRGCHIEDRTWGQPPLLLLISASRDQTQGPHDPHSSSSSVLQRPVRRRSPPAAIRTRLSARELYGAGNRPFNRREVGDALP
jgi:hypothetical protein